MYITKSYIFNIKIRQLVTEYALMIKLVDGTSSAHSFNPYAYFGYSWSYFDIQNLRLVILYIYMHDCTQHTVKQNLANKKIGHLCFRLTSPYKRNSKSFLRFEKY